MYRELTKLFPRLLVNTCLAKQCDGVIGLFDGTEHEFLSNFYPCKVEYMGDVFPTSEHAFQAAKAVPQSTIDGIETWWEYIRKADTPGKAKRLGGNCPMRDDWEDVKCGVMRDIVRNKFTQNPELAERLLATGNKYLIEGTYWHDNYWGVCLVEECKKCGGMNGKNKLGEILMIIRQELSIPDGV